MFLHYKPTGLWYNEEDVEKWYKGGMEPVTVEQVRRSQQRRSRTVFI